MAKRLGRQRAARAQYFDPTDESLFQESLSTRMKSYEVIALSCRMQIQCFQKDGSLLKSCILAAQSNLCKLQKNSAQLCCK